MNNNQWPVATWNQLKKSIDKLGWEKINSDRKRKLAKRNHRKRMSVQQKRAAQGKAQ